MSRQSRRIGFALFLTVAAVLPSRAAITGFTDLTLWQTAATGTILVTNFEGIAPSGGTTQFLTPGYDDPNGNRYAGTGFTPGLGIFDDTYIISATSGFGTWPSDYLWGGYSTNGTGFLTITLAAGASAAGMDVFNYQGGGITSVPVVVQALGSLGSNVSVTVNTLAAPGVVFAGFVATGGETITSITLTPSFTGGGATATLIDNFRSNAPAPVPEPTTFGLIGLGLIGVAALRRR